MARLYSPGEKIRKKQETTYTPVAETWNPLAYVAKTPTYLYQMLRSNPLMAPNPALQKVWPELAAREQKIYEEYGKPSLYVSPEESRKEIAQVLPEFMTRPLSGDWLANILTREGLAAGLTGGLSSFPSAIKSGLSALAGYGLPAAGEALGYPEVGKALGAAGSIAAAHLPTAFAREQGYEMPGKRAQREYDEARMKIPQEQEVLQKNKNIRIEQEQAKIKLHEDKIQKLKQKRSKLYDKARLLEGDTTGDASRIKQIVGKEGPSVFVGLNPMDKMMLQELESSLNANPELSLTTAKQYKEHLNSIIYKKNTPKPLKRGLQNINNELRNFIDQTGPPEHTKAYNAADKYTQQMYKNIEASGNVIKETKQAIKKIQSEKISPVQLEEWRTAKEKAGELAKKENLSFFEKVKSQLTPATMAIIGALSGAAGVPMLYKPFTALGGGALAYGLYNEQKILTDIQKHNPALYKKFIKEINDATPQNVGRIANRLNALSDKIEIPQTSEIKRKKRSGLYMPNQI